MGEVALLALSASFNPTLLAATTMMRLLDRPTGLMAGYLVGAYLTSITLGLIIVFSLTGSGTTNTVKNTLSPVADLALGLLALVCALVIRSGWPERRLTTRRAHRASQAAKPPRWQGALSNGSPRVAFAVGAVLTLPGASTIAGLYEIHRLQEPAAVTVLLVIGFNIVMLWLIEVPLVGYAVAPDRTPQAVGRAKRVVARHAQTFAVRGLELVAFLLVLKGVLGLLP
ncbi:MAG: GAP family protein [Solirubrobacteraceae bacterium]